LRKDDFLFFKTVEPYFSQAFDFFNRALRAETEVQPVGDLPQRLSKAAMDGRGTYYAIKKLL